MNRLTSLLLIGVGALALSSCAPMLAASAVSMVEQSARPAGNEALQPRARDACTAQAAQYGAVTVNVVEQHRINEIIVWGTVDDGKQMRSFECDFTTKITGFSLRNTAPVE